MVFWLTGLSGAGKSTIAMQRASQLSMQGRRIVGVNGDALRRGVNTAALPENA